MSASVFVEIALLLPDPFVPNKPFLYLLKTSENLMVFWCFQDEEKGCIGNKWINVSLWKSVWWCLPQPVTLHEDFEGHSIIIWSEDRHLKHNLFFLAKDRLLSIGVPFNAMQSGILWFPLQNQHLYLLLLLEFLLPLWLTFGWVLLGFKGVILFSRCILFVLNFLSICFIFWPYWILDQFGDRI